MEEFIKETIVKAGEIIMPFFGAAEVIRTKEKITDIVTQADIASQKVIIDAIKEKYPDHGIVSEEAENYNTCAKYVWYIDPLDGTKNFASRVPLFGINIALTYGGELIRAAIYLPATKEFCYAEAGRGTYLNGKKIKCSAKKEWAGAYGLGPPGCSPEYVKFQQAVCLISQKTVWINTIGCPAACAVWVADGRRDWFIGPSSVSWDYAAPALVAKEAGCRVSNFSGTDWRPGDRGLILANEHLYPQLLEIVKSSFLPKTKENL